MTQLRTSYAPGTEESSLALVTCSKPRPDPPPLPQRARAESPAANPNPRLGCGLRLPLTRPPPTVWKRFGGALAELAESLPEGPGPERLRLGAHALNSVRTRLSPPRHSSAGARTSGLGSTGPGRSPVARSGSAGRYQARSTIYTPCRVRLSSRSVASSPQGHHPKRRRRESTQARQAAMSNHCAHQAARVPPWLMPLVGHETGLTGIKHFVRSQRLPSRCRVQPAAPKKTPEAHKKAVTGVQACACEQASQTASRANPTFSGVPPAVRASAPRLLLRDRPKPGHQRTPAAEGSTSASQPAGQPRSPRAAAEISRSYPTGS